MANDLRTLASVESDVALAAAPGRLLGMQILQEFGLLRVDFAAGLFERRLIFGDFGIGQMQA